MSVIDTKDKQKTVAVAENGTEVTGEMIEGWAEAYDKGCLPEGYAFSGFVQQGRPPLYGEKMASITIRVPERQKCALEKEALTVGATLSSYVRGIIAMR